MKLLFLNGSPRVNGNTKSVLKLMESKLLSKGEIEFLDICNLKLSGCIACDSCKKNNGQCFTNDDTNKIIDKIEQSDVIIFGTPVYWWGISSQLKMVVDKLYSRVEKISGFSKKVGVVVIGADNLQNPQYQLIDKQFQCILEYLNWEYRFNLSLSAYESKEILKDEHLEEKIDKVIEKL